jgi:hypothetical protein
MNEGGFLWNGTIIYGTKRLHKVVQAHFRDGGDDPTIVDPGFIEAIEATFALSGVPWSVTLLLPIQPGH